MQVISTSMSNILGYNFKNGQLLEEALTHPGARKQINYERLEFLGDAVLGMVVSEMLFQAFPDEPEGGLAKRRAALVCGKTLSDLARVSGFIQHITGTNNMEARQITENNLENMFESVIGAIFLDSDYVTTRTVIEAYFMDLVRSMESAPRDPKSELQERVQARGLPLPHYEVIKREGPDHAPHFSMQVTIQDLGAALGEGSSKKEAEKAAAEAMLEIIDESDA